MNPITYRPYQDRDARDVKAILDEAFEIHRFVGAPRLLGSALEVYLCEGLLASTYAQVAVKDGQVVGILMGRVAGQPRLDGALGNRLRTWAHMLKLAVIGFPQRRSLWRFFSFSRVYRSLRRRTTVPLTDELTLFAVSTAARGLGAGGALYRDYLEHLRQHGRTSFFLYTDTQCTYGFYDRHGMTRAAEQDMTVYLDGQPERLGVYLYTGTVV